MKIIKLCELFDSIALNHYNDFLYKVAKSRLELAKEKYPDQEYYINQFSEKDPSGNNKYLFWLLKHKSEMYSGDLIELINIFHKFKSRFPDKNIDNYTAKSLNEAIQDITHKPTKNEIKKSKEFVDKIYEDNDYNVYFIKSLEAARIYGANTKWCITSLYSDEFKRYHCPGISYVFYIIKKKPKNDKYDKIAQVYEIYPIDLDENKKHYIKHNVDIEFIKHNSRIRTFDSEDKELFEKEFNLEDIIGINYIRIVEAIYEKITKTYNSMLNEEKQKIDQHSRIQSETIQRAYGKYSKIKNPYFLISFVKNNKNDSEMIWALYRYYINNSTSDEGIKNKIEDLFNELLSENNETVKEFWTQFGLKPKENDTSY